MKLRKHGKFKRKRKGFYKSSENAKATTMVNRSPAKLHLPIASRYLTKLTCGFTGYTPTGASSASGNFGVMALGSLDPPFADASYISNPFTSMNGSTLSPATLALSALKPVGSTALSTLYSKIRIFSSKLTITCTPSAGADTLTLVVCPEASNSGTGYTNPVDVQNAMALPFSKAITCTGNNNIKQNTIFSYNSNNTLLGQTRKQFLDDGNNYQIFSNNIPPDAVSNVAKYNISYCTQGGSDLTAKLFWEVKIDYWVELSDPIVTSES